VKDLVTTLQQKSDKHLLVRIRSCFGREKKILLKATTTQEDCEFQEEEKNTLCNQFLGGSWRQESDGSQARNPLRATLLQKGKIVIPGQG
jgi:hypothetical protein